jgi:uncharacterized protein YjbJ (UPF0337 family)
VEPPTSNLNEDGFSQAPILLCLHDVHNFNEGGIMALNENVLKGKWLEIKGELLKAWGRLTDDELDKTKGDAGAIGGLLVQKYGQKQEDYRDRLDQILRRYEDKKDRAAERIKDSLRNDDQETH